MERWTNKWQINYSKLLTESSQRLNRDLLESVFSFSEWKYLKQNVEKSCLKKENNTCKTIFIATSF